MGISLSCYPYRLKKKPCNIAEQFYIAMTSTYKLSGNIITKHNSKLRTIYIRIILSIDNIFF